MCAGQGSATEGTCNTSSKGQLFITNLHCLTVLAYAICVLTYICTYACTYVHRSRSVLINCRAKVCMPAKCICSLEWCGVVWCSVVWSGVEWCGVVWCGVVLCSVVLCSVV